MLVGCRSWLIPAKIDNTVRESGFPEHNCIDMLYYILAWKALIYPVQSIRFSILRCFVVRVQLMKRSLEVFGNYYVFVIDNKS